MSKEIILERKYFPWAVYSEMNEDKFISEAEAIERVKKGDKEAYQVIVESYKEKAYYIALSFVHNSQDALDISQEAFIKAFRKIKKFDNRRPFFPWFYKLLKNLCLDFLKRSRKMEEVPLNGVQILKTEKEDREMKKILWEGIGCLPIDQREIILLRYFQQLSYQEIADIIEKPIGTVMSSLYYAKKHLKKILEKYLCFE